MTSVRLKSSGRQVRLGRIRPVGFRESDRFREVILPGGRVKVFAKLGPHWEGGARAEVPASVDWYTKAAAAIAQMDGNDTLGDCVIASSLHQTGVWTAGESGAAALSRGSEAADQYAAICGPGDQGCVITDVLDWRKSRGLTLSGVTHRIDDYVAIDWTNQDLVRAALETFGAIELGINLPQAWTDTDVVWEVPQGSGAQIVGGHDVPAFGYGSRPAQVKGAADDGVVIATWAGLCLITWPAFLSKTWIEEAYVPLSPDWYARDDLAPNGFDPATLRADLAALADGQIPPIGPTPTPPGPTPPTPAPPTPQPPAPAVLFTVSFGRAVRKGGPVAFRAPVAIPAGVYGVAPFTPHASVENEDEAPE